MDNITTDMTTLPEGIERRRVCVSSPPGERRYTDKTQNTTRPHAIIKTASPHISAHTYSRLCAFRGSRAFERPFFMVLST